MTLFAMDFIYQAWRLDCERSQRVWCPKRVASAIPDYRGPFASIQCFFSNLQQVLICVDRLQDCCQIWWGQSSASLQLQAAFDDFINSTGFYCCRARAYRRHLIWPHYPNANDKALGCHPTCWIIFFLRSIKGLEYLSSVLGLWKGLVSPIWRTQLSIDSIHMNEWLSHICKFQ